MEMTLVLFKPDTVHRGLIGTVTTYIENRGYKIIAMKMIRADGSLLREHYAEHLSKPFFPWILSYMSSGPIVALVIEGPDAMAQMRNLLGSTHPADSSPGSVRGQYAHNIRMNLMHASDSKDAAVREIPRFFSEFEICSYERIAID